VGPDGGAGAHVRARQQRRRGPDERVGADGHGPEDDVAATTETSAGRPRAPRGRAAAAAVGGAAAAAAVGGAAAAAAAARRHGAARAIQSLLRRRRRSSPRKVGNFALFSCPGDTLASEIGKAYGKTCYLSTTLKRVPPGTEGAVSLEGTLAGVAGSLVIAGYATAVGLVTPAMVPVAAVAAFVATTCESWLGATLQGGIFTNEVINFINTLIGAVVAAALARPLL